MADVVSGYLSMIDHELPRIIERLRSVQFVNRPAVDVLQTWDSPSTLFYCDPPYLHDTRHKRSRDVYGYEMTESEHRELAQVLRECRGKVVLSGYPSPLYEELDAGWKTVAFDIANHAAGGRLKARKQEVLWLHWN
jgi:DNA adenine methylase